MGVKSQNLSPFPRIARSRVGFGLALKSSDAREEDWYIPYSGPYELPHKAQEPRQRRDSWGDPIDVPGQGVDGDEHIVEESPILGSRFLLPRDRAVSLVSARTASSGIVDPSRSLATTLRRSTASQSTRPPIPSYISLDSRGSGGVGESPNPAVQRQSFVKEGKRASVAGFVAAFGGGGGGGDSVGGGNNHAATSGRGGVFTKFSRSPPPPPLLAESLVPPGIGIGYNKRSHRRSLSSGSTGLLGRANSLREAKTHGVHYGDKVPHSAPIVPSRENGHGNTLSLPPSPSTPFSPSNSYSHSYSHSQPHPYACVCPSSQFDTCTERTSPLSSSSPNTPRKKRHHFAGSERSIAELYDTNALRKEFNTPLRRKLSAAGIPLLRGLRQLKNSISTPDLRFQVKTQTQTQREKKPEPAPGLFKGKGKKDRWLSAETWCDALLFPRPRLKVRYGKDGHRHERWGSGSGRIVSPPGSPVPDSRLELEEGEERVGGEQAVASKVLAHSRSIADVRSASSSRPAGFSSGMEMFRSREAGRRPEETAGSSRGCRERHAAPAAPAAARPRSLSLDESSLPSVVPSVTQVLEEQQQLEQERKRWQDQATQSFRNSLMRKVSRTRSKSLTRQGRRSETPAPSKMEFLAARAYLGNQIVMPTIAPSSSSPIPSSSSPSARNSLKPLFKARSSAHLRSDSWSITAFKRNTSTNANSRPAREIASSGGGAGLEQALKREDTKVIKLVDPALISVKGQSDEAYGHGSCSPASFVSDARIGIAIGTPPVEECESEAVAVVGRSDVMRMPAHPYAQGRTYYQPQEREREHGDEDRELDGDGHHHPPQEYKPPPPPPTHPYAYAQQQHYLTRDSWSDERIVIYPREDSDVPPPAKMWAPCAPGAVREVLPREIVYTPVMSDGAYDWSDEAADLGVRRERPPSSTSPTRGSCRSSEHAIVGDSSDHVQRTFREPVLYDATRPVYVLQTRPSVEVGKVGVGVEEEAVMGSSGSEMDRPDLPLDVFPSADMSLSDSHEEGESSERDSNESLDSPEPAHSPRPFDNPDSLDNFDDLFYRSPGRQPLAQLQRPHSDLSMSGYPMSLPGSMSTRSGLTYLVRSLSEGLDEEGAGGRGGIVNGRRQGMDSTLDFVFEGRVEVGEGVEVMEVEVEVEPGMGMLSPFHLGSGRVPEDVESSRASSFIETVEDETAKYRVGLVEPVSTPPVVQLERRSSYVGQTLFAGQQPQSQEGHEQEPSPPQPSLEPASIANTDLGQPRVVVERLLPVLTSSDDPIRDSYMTSSSMSRISRLSDFPAPPVFRHMIASESTSSYFSDDSRSVRQLPGLDDREGSSENGHDQAEVVLGPSSSTSYFSFGSGSASQLPVLTVNDRDGHPAEAEVAPSSSMSYFSYDSHSVNQAEVSQLSSSLALHEDDARRSLRSESEGEVIDLAAAFSSRTSPHSFAH